MFELLEETYAAWQREEITTERLLASVLVDLRDSQLRREFIEHVLLLDMESTEFFSIVD